MYSLLIDTHFSKVTIVIYKNGKLLKFNEENSNQSHSIITMPLLEKMLVDVNLNIKDFSEIIVVNGPGSFTGVRIGVTISKTISYCLNIPIKVISSLEVLACNIESKNDKIVAFNDRNGYFIGKFTFDNKLINEYFYLSNKEYEEYKLKHDIHTNVDINYETVYKMTIVRDYINPHMVNPLYVKKIEVQK